MTDWILAHIPQIAAALGAGGLHVAAILFAAMAGHLQATSKSPKRDPDAARFMIAAFTMAGMGWLLALVAT